MNPEASYLGALERTHFAATSAHRAAANVENRSDAWLYTTLRHHDDDSISDRETWLRDEFDYLLSFYGIVEIAALIGLVPAEFPSAFTRRHLRILRHPAVRRYYEWNYPLTLPARFRLRLAGLQADRLPDHPQSVPAFFSFLELTRVIERDPAVEQFLWMLDGGSRQEKETGRSCDIDTLLGLLRRDRQFSILIAREPQEGQVTGASCAWFRAVHPVLPLLRPTADGPR